jgi:hypothetical protein
MTAFIKIGLWIGAAVILALTVWLGWQNRASEKFQVNLPTALLVGFGTVLVTLIFSLKPESVKEEFPVDFIVEPRSKQPLKCTFFPGITSYTTPGAGVGLRSWEETIVPILRQAAPQLVDATDPQSLEQIYRDVLLRIVLDVIEMTFMQSWDTTVTHFNLPSGQRTQFQAASNPPRHGIKMPRKNIAAHFPQSYGLQEAAFLSHLNLPPKTEVFGVPDSAQTVLKLQNAFATVKIAITHRGMKSGVGEAIHSLCRLNVNEEHKFRTISFVISI